jgi:23S rRNA pseudoU1915 N3-methylase RlmH
MTMVRKQVYIERQQDDKLKRLSKRLGVTEAELMRQAIESLPEEKQPKRQHSEAWLRILEIINTRRATLPLSNGGRTWTREQLYGGRPKYLSR